MSLLFSPMKIKNQKIKNRIFVSPMCQYSAVDGLAQVWHLVHLGSFAKGGAGLVMFEATAVSPEGRISPGDLGLWNDQQALALKASVDFIHSQQSVSAIQLAHAGRKARTPVPWKMKGSSPLSIENMPTENEWPIFGPSALPYSEGSSVPLEMSGKDLERVKQQFVAAAKRADQIGIQVVEIHAAHGYLLHEFLSPLSNQRKDRYGGSLENRMRYPLEVVQSVRDVWPAEKPLFVRISATDWVQGGWDLEQSILFCQRLRELGVDLIDVSSGGLSPLQQLKVEPLYQTPFSAAIMKEAKIKTGAVGLITTAMEAETVLQKSAADVVFIGRQLLRDPHWPLRAAHELNVEIEWPQQYLRAKF